MAVGTGLNVVDPGLATYVTPLAANRADVDANDLTPAAVPTDAHIDLLTSRLGANNIVLFYVTDSKTIPAPFSVDIQLWVDIAAQGSPSQWVKIGTTQTAAGGAGEGALLRYENVPSGLLAPQLLGIAGEVDVSEQHTI